METLDRDVLRIATRRVWSKADGTRVVEAWRRSGLSRAAFARHYGLPVHRVYYWIANTAEHPGRGGPPRPPHAVVRRFHPVRVVREVVPKVVRPRGRGRCPRRRRRPDRDPVDPRAAGLGAGGGAGRAAGPGVAGLMFTLPSSVRISVASEPTDLRRGFDGLSALTRSVIGADPMSGHLFVFSESTARPD